MRRYSLLSLLFAAVFCPLTATITGEMAGKASKRAILKHSVSYRCCKCEILHFSTVGIFLLKYPMCCSNLKLQLQTQFPASNDEKYFCLRKIDICYSTIWLPEALLTKYLMDLSGIVRDLKLVWNQIIYGPSSTRVNTRLPNVVHVFNNF